MSSILLYGSGMIRIIYDEVDHPSAFYQKKKKIIKKDKLGNELIIINILIVYQILIQNIISYLSIK